MVTGVEGNVVGTDNNEDRIKWTASKCTVQPGHPFVECGSSSSSSIGAHALHHFEVPCLCIADDDVAVEFQCTDGAPSCDFTLDQALVYVWVPERWDASSAGAPFFYSSRISIAVGFVYFGYLHSCGDVKDLVQQLDANFFFADCWKGKILPTNSFVFGVQSFISKIIQ